MRQTSTAKEKLDKSEKMDSLLSNLLNSNKINYDNEEEPTLEQARYTKILKENMIILCSDTLSQKGTA